MENASFCYLSPDNLPIRVAGAGKSVLWFVVSRFPNVVAFGLAQLLLEHGADVNSQDRYNVTPLHVASCKDLFELARMFLDHGANPNSKGNKGQTPLHSLVKHSRNFSSSGLGLAQLLLKHGADVNAQDKNNVTRLHLASHEGQFEIARMLLGHGANPKAINDQGQTPLHLLSEGIYNSQHVLDPVELFLKCGANVNARDKNDITPLYSASQRGQLEIARMLLGHGANPNAVDDQGRTPLHRLSAGDNYGCQELDLVELLLKCGADMNAQDKNNVTRLHLASREGQFEIVRMLLGHGANPKAMNDQGQTPLHLLSEGFYDSQDVLYSVELFLKCGADVNARDKHNVTPFYLALERGKLEIALILFRNGANVNAEDSKGNTSYLLAASGEKCDN